jgi:hypothetical protein
LVDHLAASIEHGIELARSEGLLSDAEVREYR